MVLFCMHFVWGGEINSIWIHFQFRIMSLRKYISDGFSINQKGLARLFEIKNGSFYLFVWTVYIFFFYLIVLHLALRDSTINTNFKFIIYNSYLFRLHEEKHVIFWNRLTPQNDSHLTNYSLWLWINPFEWTFLGWPGLNRPDLSEPVCFGCIFIFE